MFIFNFKIDKNLIFKCVFVALLILVLIIAFVGVGKIINSKEKDDSACENSEKVNIISSSNYTDVLQTVHSNLDEYVGKKVSIVGYVYRLYDFSDNNFVIARQMIISQDMQAVVVGFLCDLNEGKQYKDGTWIQIEGTIQRGNYHGEIPMIKIDKIQEVNVPTDEYVYPPSTTYIPNSQGL